jgi:RHS repeat-associated protein
MSRAGGTIMKNFMQTMALTAASTVLLLTAAPCAAETVLNVTQINYDAAGRAQCTAVRMNPSAYNSLPDACTLGTAGSFGDDRITKTYLDAAGQVLEVDQGVGTGQQRAYARYSYTYNSQKATEMDANGNKTMYVYDGLDRLSQIQYPSTTLGSGSVNTADYELFGYDPGGNKTSWRRRNGYTISYSYDAAGKQTMLDVPVSPGNANGTDMDVYTAYDLTGNILYARFSSTSGAGVTNTYDGLNRLSSTTDSSSRTLSFTYNLASQRTGLQFPDGVTQGYNYNQSNQLTWTGVASPNVAMSFGYDDLDRLVAQGRSNGIGTGFGYDALDRLTAMSQTLPSDGAHNASWTFDHSPSGQIVSQDAGSTIYDYREKSISTDNRTYDGLNRDAAIAALSGGYDTNGNLANDGSRIMTYDVFNRLIAISGSASGTLTYDTMGRLASTNINGTVTTYFYDGTDLIAEYNGSGTMLRRYMHTSGSDQPFVELAGSGLGSPKYLLDNYQGSIIAMADSSGVVSGADIHKYGPYGEPKNSSDQESWTGSRFGYTGQTAIPEARLYYYKARIYDPAFGRFLQTDPIGTKDDLDLYAYVAGDPINRTDPSGMAKGDVTGTGVSGTAGGQTCNAQGNDCTIVVTRRPSLIDKGVHWSSPPPAPSFDRQPTLPSIPSITPNKVLVANKVVGVSNCKACDLAYRRCIANKVIWSRQQRIPANDNGTGLWGVSCGSQWESAVGIYELYLADMGRGVGRIGGVRFPDGTLVRFPGYKEPFIEEWGSPDGFN